jgi:hypothetical protein
MDRHISREISLAVFLLVFCVIQPGATAQELPTGESEEGVGLFLIKDRGVTGFINPSGEMVVTIPFERAEPFSDGMSLVWEGNRYGFVDREGNVVVEPRFKTPPDGPEPEGFLEGLAAVSIEDPDNPGSFKFGFIDKTGSFAIEPIFDGACGFHEGLALVATLDTSGARDYAFIDKSGERVLEPEFDMVGSFHEGMALVVKDQMGGFMDRQGKVVIEPRYPNFVSGGSDFSEGLAVFVDENELCGFIDTDGNEVIPAQYIMACPFSEGLALVATTYTGDLEQTMNGIGMPEDLGWGYIDKSGAMVIEPRFTMADSFHDGLARVFIDTIYAVDIAGDVYYINKSGDIALGPYVNEYFPEADPNFSEGLAAECGPCGYQYVNKEGAIVARGFERAGRFSEGLAPVRLASTYGYIDGEGQILVEPQFTEAYDFSDRLARVRAGDRYGFIDASGTIAIEPQFIWAGDFHDGMARIQVEDRGRQVLAEQVPKRTSYGFGAFGDNSPLDFMADGELFGFIDRTGRIAVEPRYDYAADFSDGLAWVMCFPQISNDIIDEELLPQLSSYDLVTRMEGFWNGFIDKEGNRVLEYDCFEGSWFSLPPARFGNGLVHFQSDGRYGFMDRNGNVVIGCRFDNAEDFSGGLASVRVNDTYAHIDTTGRLVEAPPTDDFSEDLKAMRDDSGNYGYVDRTGAFVSPPRFKYAGPFHMGIAEVTIEAPYTGYRFDACINKSGDVIWEARHWEPENQ